MTAAIDGSEEVWSAILASTLTHIAVFVPLLFLTGVVEHHVRAAFGRRHVLAGDVAVRRRHDRAGALLALLKLPPPRDAAQGPRRRALHASASGCLDGMDEGYRAAHARGARSTGRPSSAIGAASVVAAVLILPTHRRRADAADRRGRGQRERRAAGRHARRAHRGRAAAARGAWSSEHVPEADDVITQAGGGGGGFGGGGGGEPRSTSRSSSSPKDERTRTSDRSPRDLRRQLSGHPRRRSSAPTPPAATSS